MDGEWFGEEKPHYVSLLPLSRLYKSYKVAAYCKGLHFLVLKNFEMVEKRVFFHDAKEFIDVACSIRMGEMETKELRSKVLFIIIVMFIFLE